MGVALMIFGAIGFIWSLFQTDEFSEECERVLREIEGL